MCSLRHFQTLYFVLIDSPPPTTLAVSPALFLVQVLFSLQVALLWATAVSLLCELPPASLPLELPS